jgi:hypothetical protein
LQEVALITKDEARANVLEYLRKRSVGKSYELWIIDSQTREEAFGWVFFYNTMQFAETKDPEWCLAGNAPLIVDRETGALNVTGTAHDVEYYLDKYRKTGHL